MSEAGVRTALASALLVITSTACSRSSTTSSTSSNASSTSSAVASVSPPAPSGEPSAGVSRWSKDSTEPIELVVAPDRAAYVAFEGRDGYVLHRGQESKRLPRVWFGAGPPRRDISISGDGTRLAVPEAVLEGELIAVTVYDTGVLRFVGRFAVPQKHSPGGGGFEGKMSADGKYVVWTFTRRACMVTEIASGTLDVDGAKNKKCIGS